LEKKIACKFNRSRINWHCYGREFFEIVHLAGVMLMDICPEDRAQGNLFDTTVISP